MSSLAVDDLALEAVGLDQLMVVIGAHDQGAFAELYGRMSARTYGLAFRLLGDRQLAEEVVQEAWLHIWRHASRYQPSLGSATNWMLTIVRRRAIERIRSEEARRARDHRFAVTDLLDHHGNETADAVLEKQGVPALRAALASLSPVQREAVLVAYADDHANRDTAVAEALDVPLGTAKYRIRQALIQLRRQLSSAGRG